MIRVAALDSTFGKGIQKQMPPQLAVSFARSTAAGTAPRRATSQGADLPCYACGWGGFPINWAEREGERECKSIGH